MANQFILDLRKVTKTGTDTKLKKGWAPYAPPIGYLNAEGIDEGEKTKIIISDPERYDSVNKMWSLMLTGAYNPSQILEKANEEWGFRTKPYNGQGGNKLARSTIYKVFTNLFYTGIIPYDGQQYPGKPRSKTHVFPFTGFIRCGDCGCLITAETKTKKLKRTGDVKSYTYYHCTKKKKDYNCSQRKNIRQEDLEKQIVEELDSISILPEFHEWAMKALNELNEQECKQQNQAYDNLFKELSHLKKSKQNLLKLRLRDILTDDEFVEQKNDLSQEIIKTEQELKSHDNKNQKCHDLAIQTFNFAKYAREGFINGDTQTKKEILMALGQNPKILNVKISFQLNEWLQPIKKTYSDLEIEYKRLEPEKTGVIEAKDIKKEEICKTWLPGSDSNQRPSG